MSVNLASPTFVTGAKAEVAAADVYGLNSSVKINSISTPTPAPEGLSSLVSSSTSTLKEKLTSSLSFVNDSLKIARSATSVLSIGSALLKGKGDLLSRIASAAPQLANSIKGFPLSSISEILGSVGSVSGALVKVDGIANRIGKGNYSEITNLGSSINTITGRKDTFEILDSAASIGALSGVCESAVRRGIPNSFAALSGTLNDIDSVNRMAGKTVGTVLKNSDSSSLMCMAKDTSPGAIKMMRPDVVEGFSSNYTLPEGTLNSQLSGMFTEYKGGLKRLDPDAVSTTRQNDDEEGPIVDLSNIQRSSPDFFKVVKKGAMSSSLPEDKLLLLAPSFPATNVTSELTKQFPQTVISDPVTAINKTANPVTLNATASADVDPGILVETSSYTMVTITTTTYKYALTDGTFKYKITSAYSSGVIFETRWK